jgi:hypothetical protein
VSPLVACGEIVAFSDIRFPLRDDETRGEAADLAVAPLTMDGDADGGEGDTDFGGERCDPAGTLVGAVPTMIER